MKQIKLFSLIFLAMVIFTTCNKEEIDKQKPEIDLSMQGTFPLNCDTLYFGESFDFKVLFKDNAELGSTKSYSIDIHHNFDHHSHSTEVENCKSEEKKDPINPFTFIEDYDIPEGLDMYETNIKITLPTTNNSGILDEGDYHFYISLTDKEGWSVQKGLSIKILHRGIN
ncbi:MAG: DUF4625 domain-containing protein [Bacteroidales bacterium]|nr:DUF4625 domain-containing protein [Bacteroidales bacterium]